MIRVQRTRFGGAGSIPEAIYRSVLDAVGQLADDERMVVNLRHGLYDGESRSLVNISDLLGWRLQEVGLTLVHAYRHIGDDLAVEEKFLAIA